MSQVREPDPQAARAAVIAGTARGRRLVAPDGDHVRPTKDIARESMFSALDARGALEDAAVLDLYAGTARSRSRRCRAARASPSSSSATGPRSPRSATNLEVLPPGTPTVVVARDVGRYLAGGPPADGPFDLVFVDPPYETPDEDVTAVLAALTAPGLARAGGDRERRAAAPAPRRGPAGPLERAGNGPSAIPF